MNKRTIISLLSTAALTCALVACSTDENSTEKQGNKESAQASASTVAHDKNEEENEGQKEKQEKESIKFATYNASLNRKAEGKLIEDLSTPNNEQAGVIATIIKSENPDVLVINEFDYDPEGKALKLFQENYLDNAYKYSFSAEVNTGVDSGLDLDNNGVLHEANDAWGYGEFPGQYGIAVLSKYPLKTDALRSFQKLLWKDMPNNLMPADYYGANADKLRLSSKSHWDLPVEIGNKEIHLLISHPTPPSFDGPEKRNGRRNSDEIRLTADYIHGGKEAEWIVDDQGQRGGLAPDAEFIVFGDQNSDPRDGGAGFTGVKQLLGQERVVDPKPTSEGAVEAARQPGNDTHSNPAENDTADFSDPTPGNLRVDYVLPSRGLNVKGSHVVWPKSDQPLGELMDPKTSSDHRMVVLEIEP
ncbi:endonuclease/exonuclease/phosphatase family protein [Corynebacterium sp. sy039]|uniref:endonuclease/exonuclease/phosphatase family protein n=1 Tax=Corynebacterium sp. sy039 TaxID=2599641 RepID=UPI0011B5F620|nr:endonuclease/exonuclease/phosphatase family protein [Corynebacterium sp. sy039]QDZ42217.1 endonuclease/exonuclease/phosphatase family protein [Corynebacterium sp. sy039]